MSSLSFLSFLSLLSFLSQFSRFSQLLRHQSGQKGVEKTCPQDCGKGELEAAVEEISRVFQKDKDAGQSQGRQEIIASPQQAGSQHDPKHDAGAKSRGLAAYQDSIEPHKSRCQGTGKGILASHPEKQPKESHSQ